MDALYKETDLVEKAWTECKKKFPLLELQRIEELIEIVLGKQQPEPKDPLQKVNPRLYIPGLEAKPWHCRDSFSFTSLLEQAYVDIKDEFLKLRHQTSKFSPYQSGYIIPQAIVQHEEGYDKTLVGEWNAFFFCSAYRWIECAKESCPNTVALLRKLPVAREALFSVINSNSHIKLHSDRTNFITTCHLGLDIPEACGIKVGDITEVWKEGECLFFDSSFLHEAWNHSLSQRAVLIIDVWHPDLTSIEIAAINYLRPSLEKFFGIEPRETTK